LSLRNDGCGRAEASSSSRSIAHVILRTLHAPVHVMELRMGRLAGFRAWRTSSSACSLTLATTTWVFRAFAAAASGDRAVQLSR
jgi:hypothetical protein